MYHRYIIDIKYTRSLGITFSFHVSIFVKNNEYK